MFSDFQYFFHCVVSHKSCKYQFTSQSKIIHFCHIFQQLDCSKFCHWKNTSSCRKLKNNPRLKKSYDHLWCRFDLEAAVNFIKPAQFSKSEQEKSEKNLTYLTMQKRLILALYTVKSNETNLVPLETHNPCLSSSIIFNDSFFDEAKSWNNKKIWAFFFHLY